MSTTRRKPPHVVIFNPDQWRGDSVGYVGNPAAVTPNLDRFVETDGVGFRNAYCQNTVSTPSRCSFMSGWYTHVRGHRTMHHMMRPDEPVLLRTLKDHGYFVWWGGKNDLVPAQHGFENYCDLKYQRGAPTNPTAWPDDWRGEPDGDNYFSFQVGRVDTKVPVDVNDESTLDMGGDWANVLGAVELIREYGGEKPLCIYLPLGYPHPPYAVEDPWYSMIDRSEVPPRVPTPEDWSKLPSMLKGIHDRQQMQDWTEDRFTEMRATYLGMCARVDHQFGMVIDALKHRGIYDDTAVFFFSDHGDFTGDYGLVEKTQNTFEECLSRVPFAIKPPAGVAARPRVSDALVELIDFPATVEAVTGIAPEHTHFGRSLLPVIAGETDEHRDAVFCEGGRRHGETQATEAESRQTPDKLYWPRCGLQGEEGPHHSKAVMCRTKDWKYVRRLYDPDELFDLRNDPGELNNLIDEPGCADVLSQLKERLLRFYLETCDVVPFDTDRRS